MCMGEGLMEVWGEGLMEVWGEGLMAFSLDQGDGQNHILLCGRLFMWYVSAILFLRKKVLLGSCQLVTMVTESGLRIICCCFIVFNKAGDNKGERYTHF